MFKSEEDFLSLIDLYFPRQHPHLLLGRGHDCAVLNAPAHLCISSDLFVQDIHFRLEYFRPDHVGHKALAVNLSDLAAMGAKPLGFELGLIWPENFDHNFAHQLFKGMSQLAKQFELALAGGDLSLGESLSLCITIWGECPKKIFCRQNVSCGDLIFVIGNVGLARAGLEMLEQKRKYQQDFPACIASHLCPVPLVREGMLLARPDCADVVKGLMDVSDGLAQDIPRFLGPDLGLEIDEQNFALHQEVKDYCRLTHQDPFIFSLQGGEDYALLGATSPDGFVKIKELLPQAWTPGKVVATPGIFLHGKRVEIKGFDHFES